MGLLLAKRNAAMWIAVSLEKQTSRLYRASQFIRRDTPLARVQGLTVRDGHSGPSQNGTALLCCRSGTAAPIIKDGESV